MNDDHARRFSAVYSGLATPHDMFELGIKLQGQRDREALNSGSTIFDALAAIFAKPDPPLPRPVPVVLPPATIALLTEPPKSRPKPKPKPEPQSSDGEAIAVACGICFSLLYWLCAAIGAAVRYISGLFPLM